MQASNSNNQNNLSRRLDGTFQAPILDDSNAEQYARAFANERQRIANARQAQLQAEGELENIENNNTLKQVQRDAEVKAENSLISRATPHWAEPIVGFAEQVQENPGGEESLSDRLKGAASDTVQGFVLNQILPAWANPITAIVQLAQQNQLAVQSFLLGIPDDLPPQVQGNFPDENYVPPVFSAPPRYNGASSISLDTNKDYYALWRYQGYVTGATFRRNIPGSSTKAQINTNYSRMVNTDPSGFSWYLNSVNSRWMYNSYNPTYPPGITASTYTGTAVAGVYDGSWESFQKAPRGGQILGSGYNFSDEEIALATAYPSPFGLNSYSSSYVPYARIIGSWQATNLPFGGTGELDQVIALCEILFACKISGGDRYEIPELDGIFYYHTDARGQQAKARGSWGTVGSNYPASFDVFSYDAYICGFMSQWQSQLIPGTSLGSVGSNAGINPSQQPVQPYLYEIESKTKYPRPPITPPPPPPPHRRCDCMPSCCPQNSNDLSDLKALLMQVIATQKKHQQLLGLDNLPYSVNVTDSKFSDMIKNASQQNPLLGQIASKWGQGSANPLTGNAPAINIGDMANLAAFLAIEKNQLADYVGEPVNFTLWDLNSTTPGNHTQTITPMTLFKAIEAIANEITLTQRIIGIDKLPVKVPRKWVSADNTVSMMQAAADALGVQSQLAFFQQLVGIQDNQTEITSVIEYLDWQSDQIDDVFGHWEIDVVIADGDLVKPGAEGTTAHILNMAQAMQKTIEASMSSNISEKAIINMVARVLIELQGIKQELGKAHSQIDVMRHYLGFATKTSVVNAPAHCNYPQPKDPKAPNDLTLVNDLPTFLQGTTIPIETEVVDFTGTLQDILIDLQHAAAIIKATNYQRVGSESDMTSMLTALATSYGLLKTPPDPNAPTDPNSFEAFLTNVENDFDNVAGRQSDTPNDPYGKPQSIKPRIREIGDNSNPVPDN